MTIKELIFNINKLAKTDKGIFDKEILISNDEEGNGYHSVYSNIANDPHEVEGIIANSNGADIDIADYSKYVILG